MRALRLALALTICAASVGGAQTPPDTARDTTRKLGTVTVTAARSTATVGGASAVVLRPEELLTSPAALLEQAVREAPFVQVRQNSRGEAELSIRGSESRQAAVLVDGVPMSLGFDHRTDPSLLPVTGASSIVIVRGLGSLLNGPNTLGGTIEIEHGAGVTNDAWMGGGVDETGSLVTTIGGERRLTSGLSARSGIAFRQRDGFNVPPAATDPTAQDGLRTNSDQKQVDGFVALQWRGSIGKSLSLNATGFDAERGVPPEEHISSPRLWRYPYSSRYVVSLAGSTGPFATPFGIATAGIGAGFNRGRMKIESFSDRTYSTVNGVELGTDKNLVGRLHASHSLGSGTLRAALTASDIRYDETLNAVEALYQQVLWSAGTELEMPIGARTSLTGGIVFDRASTPETGGRAAQPALDDFGWRAGLTRDWSDAVRLHASASQRSRFPALRELYSGALNRFQPNPDLKPETLLGFEGGFTVNRLVRTNASLVSAVTVFRHDLEDAVVRITVPNPAPPPASLFRRVNRDNIVSSGVELLGAYSVGAVSIAGDAILQRITIKDQTAAGAERHAENNPETRGSLELGGPLPLRLRGIANGRYVGKQYCLNADTGNEDSLGAKVEADVAFERTFDLKRRPFQTLRALVSVDNVSNATVFDQCGLVQPGRTTRLMFMLR
jgi:iron complex outermembrane receptor protein